MKGDVCLMSIAILPHSAAWTYQGFGFGLVWFGLVWFGLVWFGLVCCVLFFLHLICLVCYAV